MSNHYKIDDLVKEIFGSPLKKIEYPYHPSEEVLKAYVFGKLRAEQIFSHDRFSQLQRGKLVDWSRTEVNAHVLTCSRCSILVQEISVATSRRQLGRASVASALKWKFLRRTITPVPTFARIIMAAQFIAILALSGLIYVKSQPAMIISLPSGEVSVKTEQTAKPEDAVKKVKDLASQADTSLSDKAKIEQPSSEIMSSIAERPASPTSATPTSPVILAPANPILALATQLQSNNPEEQISAAQQLGGLRDSAAVAPLVQAYSTTPNAQVRKVFVSALREIWEETETKYLRVIESLQSLDKATEAVTSESDFIKDFLDSLKININLGRTDENYPISLKITFHQDVTLRELNSLSRSLGGWITQNEGNSETDEIIIKLPQKSAEELKNVIQQLERNPKVRQVRKLQ